MAGVKTLLLLALAVVPALADNYDIVWDQVTDYSNWASDKTIRVGDTATFKYGGSHTVDEVTQADYTSCSSSSVLSSKSDGNTMISFTQSGTRYFICATAGHCAGGMKISIPVSAASSAPSTPTTPAGTPPTGSTPPSTSSTPSSPSAQNSPGAAAGLQPGKALLLVGAFLAGGLALLC